MHEYTLIQGIINEILTDSSKYKCIQSKSVNLGIGAFSHEKFENLELWWNKLTVGTVLEGKKLIKTDIPGKLYCSKCSQEFVFQEHHDTINTEITDVIICPICGSVNTEIIDGTDILILDS